MNFRPRGLPLTPCSLAGSRSDQRQCDYQGPGDDPRLGGVRDGTLCFSYTSPDPGEHTVFVNFLDDGTTRPAPRSIRTATGKRRNPTGRWPAHHAWNKLDSTVLSTQSAYCRADNITEITIRCASTSPMARSRQRVDQRMGAGLSHNQGVLKTGQLLDGALLRWRSSASAGIRDS